MRAIAPQLIAHGRHAVDSYELLSAAIVIACAVMLVVHLVYQRGTGRDVWPATRLDEALFLGAAVGAVVLLVHQFVTDGLCHGGCG